MKKLIKKCLDKHIMIIKSMYEYSHKINMIAEEMTKVLKNNGKILLCGNGGSAADAQHIATEFVVRFRSEFERKSLPAIALTTDTSLLTACANDYGYDTIFARQVEGLGNEGDFLVGISTSGNSPNVYKAIEIANKKKMKTFLLSGKKGGKIKNISNSYIIVPSNDTARIQEAHITICHIICLLVEMKYFNIKK